MEIKIKEAQVFVTARETGERISNKTNIAFINKIDENSGEFEQENSLINIYEDVHYQRIEGFGGAITEAAAVTYNKLSEENKKEILKAYFDSSTGNGYTFCRTHINSCDFSLGNYHYLGKEYDISLGSFNIDHDRKMIIPLIKDAINSSNSEFKLLASPWSPPPIMKSNNQMNKGGKLKKEYYDVWARYLCKYIKELKNEGIDIWAMSIQNEAKAVQPWDSCVYSAQEELDFVKHHLGPLLEHKGLSDVKLVMWDHNKERVFDRAKVYYADSEGAKYIWGIGFHWYSGDHFENLDITNKIFPDKKLLFTEGCQEGGVKLGSWDTGERYAHDIIGNLNNWAVGFIDWNILLDEMGGPNHVGNYCDAPIIADTKNNKIIYESSYYYIGHFSRFIRPGAVRIGYSKFTDKLEVTAFKNPDNKIVVVVLNRTEEIIQFSLRTMHGIADYSSLPHSIATLVYEI